MSVGAWEPESAANACSDKTQFDRNQLQRFIAAAQSSAPLMESLAEADQRDSRLIRLPAQSWLEESAHWSDEQLWQLIRFFTLAEMQLPGWDAGAESAVIPLSKALRQRNTPLSREQLLWIRQNSNNRYLPYGPL
ncbi:hypothetical protein [Microbulbifer thermotolerans]|uniref:Uncharacterized protein n=1 Tax=Microbulbifer thermotolerans TaxID=252514 RepID=A0AB35HUT0_MICTH|nr:hypothetical protein [Microbulbifer thermotolerans]MCX2801252.1 hypothetical protein [Microbulbifer thermotolerans]MCX2832437.1 hypothetical protein [Microbulbifer thermotolerans]